jgi:hypothetical protein
MGRLISIPNMQDFSSFEGTIYKRIFSLSYPLFNILVDYCIETNNFDVKYYNRFSIPIPIDIHISIHSPIPIPIPIHSPIPVMVAWSILYM